MKNDIVCCECETYEDQDNCEVCVAYLENEAWQRDNS
jgi:recombinational DNA repair protein RecR